MIQQDLFIGITSWNSARFLDVCLTALSRTTRAIDTDIMVLDNCSTDGSVEIAKKHGARVIIQSSRQSDALNTLLDQSSAAYTLLIHADTVMLADNWFEHIVDNIDNDTVMVSPEDIGCGLMSRLHGKGHPESSFMFFRTREVKQFRRWKVTRRRFMMPLEVRRLLDFDQAHITHGLVELFASRQRKVCLMDVLYSRLLDQPRYAQTNAQASSWHPALAQLEYGLGNFYALQGVVTHYHNWYDRVSVHHYMRNAATTEPDNHGYPVDFVKAYSKQFIDDFNADRVHIPDIQQPAAETVLARFSQAD